MRAAGEGGGRIDHAGPVPIGDERMGPAQELDHPIRLPLGERLLRRGERQDPVRAGRAAALDQREAPPSLATERHAQERLEGRLRDHVGHDQARRERRRGARDGLERVAIRREDLGGVDHELVLERPVRRAERGVRAPAHHLVVKLEEDEGGCLGAGGTLGVDHPDVLLVEGADLGFVHRRGEDTSPDR